MGLKFNSWKEVTDGYYKAKNLSLDDAIDALRKINKKTPDPRTRIELAKLYIEKRNIDKAQEILEKMRSDERYIRFFESIDIQLAKINIVRKEFDDARAKLSDISPDRLKKANKLKARIERKEGNYEEAKSQYLKLIKEQRSIVVAYELGLLEINNGTYDEARKVAGILRQLGAPEFATKIEGLVEFSTGNYDNAKRHFESLIGSSQEADARLYLGSIYFEESNHAKALENFEKLLGTKNEMIATYKIAKIKDAEGFHEEAYNDYMNCYRNIDDEYINIDIARALCYQGKFDEAITYLDKVNNKKDRVSAQYKKAYILIHLNRFMEALNLFKQNFRYGEYSHGLPFFWAYTHAFPGGNYDLDSLKYSSKQYFKYKTKRAINHIKEHLSEDDTKEVHTLFYENLDIEKLFFEVREKIKNQDIDSKEFVEKYIVKSDTFVGNMSGIDTEYVQVVVVPGTKNILTMYPIVVSEMYRKRQRTN